MSDDVLISVAMCGVTIAILLAVDHLQRHPPRFSLRAMLITTTAIALALGLVAYNVGK